MKTYVTFGQEHTHRVNGKLFDKDCVAVIEARDMTEGRQLAFDYFGPKFCFTYNEAGFQRVDMEYFPRGFIEVN